MELKCPFPSSAVFTSLDDTIFLTALILDTVFLLLYTTYKSYFNYRRQTWIIMDVLCKCMSDKEGRSGSLWLVKLMQPRDFFLNDYHLPSGQCFPTFHSHLYQILDLRLPKSTRKESHPCKILHGECRELQCCRSKPNNLELALVPLTTIYCSPLCLT